MGEFKIIQQTIVTPVVPRIPHYYLWFIGAIALVIRFCLFPYVSDDSTISLLPWMSEFREHGASALGGEFSNYNFPYLFLMFLASMLPLEPLFAIKLVSLLGDCLLALSVGVLVRQFRPARLRPATAALLALFLPTVLLNASMWGQSDSIYTSFLLLAMWRTLKDDGRGAWLWWAVAVSFKLQAVFFLPALVLISFRNRYSLALPLQAAGVWALLSIPPVLFGRSLSSTLGVYINQTQDGDLWVGAANIYSWFFTVSASEGRLPALAICGSVLLLTAYAYWRGPDSAERQVLLAVTVLAVCPLLLPQMHERYFFAAEVTSLLLVGHKKLFIVPMLFAATGLVVYYMYFAGLHYLWPWWLASIVQCLTVGMLVRTLSQKADQFVKGSVSSLVRNQV
ncbi:Gpi18-like mannosyltransferase [Arthrobacter sp. PvP102]|uniref:hypothetical protein n=1 Tax=unclassified Arthrobacter TaxID=235627 RepID=UPI001AEA2CCB|nr:MULTISPECIES: hypothetical protein [unclassified Arthrobacter]MBP1232228.1 Gpi18-like mannosyltransferase [Arthrobacter sp. PvP103]MBP1237363.1 Gpi18-like mannosyltransferase [Arthrobacter sp. PvP102]